MVYPLGKQNVDKIIDEIVSGGNKGAITDAFIGNLKKCPVCHHIIPANSKFCPYCFEVFQSDLNIKNLTEKFLVKINEISKIAASREIYIPNLIENMKNATKNLKMKKIKSAHKILQDNYLELIHRLSNSILEESKRYKILLNLDPKNKRLFKKLEGLVEDWNFNEALKELEKIKEEYDNFSRELQFFLEDLERAERAAEICEDFGIDITKTLEIIDDAKDEADKRNYKYAIEILHTAFLPIQKDIEKVMEEILEVIKSKKDVFIEENEINGRRLIRLLQELKFYWKQENLISVIEHLDEISREM